MKISTLLITALIATTALLGCGSKVSVGTPEQYNESRKNARQNCQTAADNYLRAQAGTDGVADVVIMDSDSTISRKHLQGDGICSGHFTVNGQAINRKLWCSSNKQVGGCKPVQPKTDGVPNENLDQTTPVEK